MKKKESDMLTFFQSCNSEDGLWTQGMGSYPGLWRINKKTGQADYMFDIFGHGCYIGTFECDNKIFMVPNFLSDEWLVYDKTKKTGEYKKLTPGINIQGSRTIKIDDTIWVIPQFTYAAIVSINLRTFHHDMIDDWATQISGQVYEILSHVSKDGIRLFFSIKDFDKFVELNTESKHITWYDSYIGKSIRDICIGDGRIWILPNAGNEIFCMDMRKNEIRKIDLNQFYVEHIHFILYAKKKIFLVPFWGHPIMVYYDSKQYILNYPAGFHESPPGNFWDYDINNRKLILYPCFSNMMMEIDIDTLSTTGRKITPSIDWDEEEKVMRCERNALHNGRNIDYERNRYSLKAFLKSIG